MTVSTVSNDYCLENSTRIKYETIRNDWFYLLCRDRWYTGIINFYVNNLIK